MLRSFQEQNKYNANAILQDKELLLKITTKSSSYAVPYFQFHFPFALLNLTFQIVLLISYTS